MTTEPREREEAQELPEWTDCQSAFADGGATPLTEFIRAYEPVSSTNPNDTKIQEWRQALTAVLDLAALRMRERCVARVKEIAAEWLDKAEWGWGTRVGAAKTIADALESLTLEGTKEQ